MFYDYSQKYKESEVWCEVIFRLSAYFVWWVRILVALGKCFGKVSIGGGSK